MLDFRTPHVPAGLGNFPPSERLQVISLACDTTEEHNSPDTRWSLDELAYRLVNEKAQEEMDRVTIWRILNACDLKPHRSVYWLNSQDPDFDFKADDISQLYLDAPWLYKQGHLVLSSDEKSGMQILGRTHPTQPARPGVPQKREHDYIRYGTRALLATFCVATGEVVWDLRPRRTAQDWVDHLRHVVRQFPNQIGYEWVVDNLNTHASLEVCKAVARWEGMRLRPEEVETLKQRREFLSDRSHKHVFHFTPIHGSWLNQVELFFSVLSRKFLKNGDFSGVKDFEERLERWMNRYNEEQAHPYQWTYTGQPLVRATPFSQTKQQRRAGRAWFGTRPQLFERLLHPLRPYQRRPKTVAMNL